MAVLSKQNVDDHCHNLGISRKNLTEFTISGGVTQIGDGAFFGCSSLRSITIPDNVVN